MLRPWTELTSTSAQSDIATGIPRHKQQATTMSDVVVMGPQIYTLPNVLDLNVVQSRKEVLVEAASSRSSVVPHGLDVERVGTPAVQVSLAARQTFGVRRTKLLANAAVDGSCAPPSVT
jgi:hypothetical protein